MNRRAFLAAIGAAFVFQRQARGASLIPIGEPGSVFTSNGDYGEWAEATSTTVLDHGVTGDGTTDDHAALQAIFDDIESGDIEEHTVYFPEGEYKITAALNVDVQRIRILGAGRDRTRIVQHTANTPVLLWDTTHDGLSFFDHDNEAVTRGVQVRDIGLVHNAAPTAGTPLQYGIMFRAGADGTSTQGGQSWFTLADLYLEKCYVGIGTYTTGGGMAPLWNSTIRDVLIVGTYRHAVKIRSDGSVGSTSVLIERLDVINWTGEGITNDAQVAIDINVMNGCHLDSVNIEGWVGPAIGVTGGSGCTITNPRFEWHVVNTNYDRLLYLQGDGFVVTGLEASIQFTHSGSWFHVIEAAGADTDVAVHGARVVKASGGSGTGTVAMLGGDVGARITASGLTMGAGVDEYRPSTDGTMLYARTSVDGLPPLVDALPAASATYRSRLFTIQGGAGVADRTYLCHKTAADAYEWIEVDVAGIAALALKAPLASPTFTGTVQGGQALLAGSLNPGLRFQDGSGLNVFYLRTDGSKGLHLLNGTDFNLFSDDAFSSLKFSVDGATGDTQTNGSLTVSGSVNIPDNALAIADTSGLQTALDAKANLAGANFTGSVRIQETAVAALWVQKDDGTDVLYVSPVYPSFELMNGTDVSIWSGAAGVGLVCSLDGSTGNLFTAGSVEIDGALNHDGTTVGFYGATPVAQGAANPDTSGATLPNLEIEVNQIKALLRSLGLMAT